MSRNRPRNAGRWGMTALAAIVAASCASPRQTPEISPEIQLVPGVYQIGQLTDFERNHNIDFIGNFSAAEANVLERVITDFNLEYPVALPNFNLVVEEVTTLEENVGGNVAIRTLGDAIIVHEDERFPKPIDHIRLLDRSFYTYEAEFLKGYESVFAHELFHVATLLYRAFQNVDSTLRRSFDFIYASLDSLNQELPPVDLELKRQVGTVSNYSDMQRIGEALFDSDNGFGKIQEIFDAQMRRGIPVFMQGDTTLTQISDNLEEYRQLVEQGRSPDEYVEFLNRVKELGLLTDAYVSQQQIVARSLISAKEPMSNILQSPEIRRYFARPELLDTLTSLVQFKVSEPLFFEESVDSLIDAIESGAEVAEVIERVQSVNEKVKTRSGDLKTNIVNLVIMRSYVQLSLALYKMSFTGSFEGINRNPITEEMAELGAYSLTGKTYADDDLIVQQKLQLFREGMRQMYAPHR